MTRYEVKPEWQLETGPRVDGTLEIVEDNPMTCEYLLRNEGGGTITVTYWFFDTCMRQVQEEEGE